jgi:co-chaperonin GroES (HSP10)
MLIPVEYHCVVEPERVDEKTEGGIYVPDDRREKDQAATTKAKLIAVGGNAFEEWEGMIPQPGHFVIISKYAGQPWPMSGENKEQFRIVNDKEIIAILADVPDDE